MVTYMYLNKPEKILQDAVLKCIKQTRLPHNTIRFINRSVTFHLLYLIPADRSPRHHKMDTVYTFESEEIELLWMILRLEF